MEKQRKPVIVRGQNSGLYAEQYRQYYGVFRVERSEFPNTHGDSVLVQIAENCTKEDADDLAASYNSFQAAEEMAGALKSCQRWFNGNDKFPGPKIDSALTAWEDARKEKG